MQAKTERFEFRLDQNTIDRVDSWAANQPDNPSRAEAIRRLVDGGLSRSTGYSVQFSDGEKLSILMLCELLDQRKARGEFDTKLIKDAIFGGHTWGLKWDMSGVFHGHQDHPSSVSNVTNILDMWSFIERSFAKFGKEERDFVIKEAGVLGKGPRFIGFDGNNESEYIGIARFLIKTMGRFQDFDKRDLNSHMPTIERYLRMYAVFEPLRDTLMGIDLSGVQLIEILKAERIR